jgi:anionic cell wall polymer biosynthesis LytR-Cps2A-Psr (LCP) family protein
MVLMKKAQIVIMSILTLILVAITVFVVILTSKLDKMVDEEIRQEVVIEDEEEPSVDVKTVDALQDSFDALFS